MNASDAPAERRHIKAHLVGGGIAALASAAYLIRAGDVPGANIQIFEETSILGGSLDGGGSASTGYTLRGSRMVHP